MSNMNILRSHIFETMKALRDGRMDVSTANAMSGAAQTMINTLKVEIEARKLVGAKSLPEFISPESEPVEALTEEECEVTGMELQDLIPSPGAYPQVGITRHFMRDGGNE